MHGEKRRFSKDVFFDSHLRRILIFPFLSLRRDGVEGNTSPLFFAFTPFLSPFFRRRTSVPVSRGLGRQREKRLPWFGGSVDTLIRNIMILSKCFLDFQCESSDLKGATSFFAWSSG